MPTRLPFRALLLALAAAMTAGGCTSTIIKEGAGIAMGAKGTYMPIQPLAATEDAKPLGAYRNFELGAISDGIGGRTPPGFGDHLAGAFAKELRAADLPTEAGGKTLVIRGTIVHYEDSDTVGFVLGPLEEVIVLTEFVDKQTQQVLGRANCVGRTTARVNAGVEKKAQGLAKAFVKWIESRFPADRKVSD